MQARQKTSSSGGLGVCGLLGVFGFVFCCVCWGFLLLWVSLFPGSQKVYGNVAPHFNCWVQSLNVTSASTWLSD